MPPATENLETLRRTGKSLPKPLRDAILADPGAHVAGLLEILRDDALAQATSPGAGYAPIHAVDLLADAKAAEAARPMLDVLATTDWDDILHDRILQRLPDLGAPALEPALSLIASTEDVELRHDVCSVVASLGVRDERVFDALSSFFAEAPMSGAIAFAEYGDPRALPLIEDAIEKIPPVGDALIVASELTELVSAYEDLGGQLPDALQAKVDAMLAAADARRRETFRQPTIAAARAKVGRNDPCPCGSGRKFKKCCIDAPQA